MNNSDVSAFYDRDVQTSLSNIETLLKAGIFSAQGLQSPFFRACVTQILIELSDALQKASASGKRISFKDNVYDGGKNWDVTDLIANCRNAVCHISSSKHLFETNKFTFNRAAGYSPTAFCINGTVLGCEFEDDVAVFFGSMKLLLNRNVIRAQRELRSIFPSPWSR